MIGIIIASGESKRMKSNKLLLKYNGKTLIENVIQKAVDSNLEKVIVVCKDEEVKRLADMYGVQVIVNNKFMFGQSESIKLAIKNIQDKSDYMFFVGDIPLIKTKTINKMIEKFNEVDGIVVAKYKEKITNPAIFSYKFKKDLLELQGDVGGRAIIKNYSQLVSYYSIDDEREVIDIDTREDYEKLLSNS